LNIQVEYTFNLLENKVIFVRLDYDVVSEIETIRIKNIAESTFYVPFKWQFYGTKNNNNGKLSVLWWIGRIYFYNKYKRK